jgi:hypothetical protein
MGSTIETHVTPLPAQPTMFFAPFCDLVQVPACPRHPRSSTIQACIRVVKQLVLKVQLVTDLDRHVVVSFDRMGQLI